LMDYVQSALPDWEQFWNEWNTATENNNSEKIAELSQQQLEWEERYGYAPEHYCRQILSGLGFTEHEFSKTLRELSGGFRERAKLARVLIEGVDILLLDEPINHLDIEAIEWLEKFLLHFEGIIVFIAHDRVFMDTVATHTLYLGGSKPFFRKGSYSAIMDQLQEIEEQKKLQSQRLEKEIEEKIDFVERFKAKASKARQAASRQKMVKKLEKELESLQPEKKHRTVSFTFPQPHKAEKTLIVAEDISKQFNETTLWKNLNFTIYNDSIIALVGANGIGKSTLLKIILGNIQPSTGNITKSSSLRFGYFSQHQSDTLYEHNTVIEEMRRLTDTTITDEERMGVLGRFLLGQQYFERSISSLSGGEKNRLILASIFLSKANLLIFDEPTNHLDLETRYALTLALSNFQGAILLIAHDRYLLKQVAKEYWHLSQSGITSYYTYDEYIKAKQAQIESIPATKKETAKSNSATNKESTTLSKEERKKQKQREATIRAEYYARIQPLKKQYDSLEQTLTELYQRVSEIETTLSLAE
ncbi:MAG: ATP-binding cassette domain-containing protein, partial [Desulfovibrionaceae bacterium]|nr:ATP-binding cassette domain-containing protein [Desulfovibrionaceae bacterium]